MIDVVFLLLVFFMLAARFSVDGAIEVSLSTTDRGEYSGPPRLIGIAPEKLYLNGQESQIGELRESLSLLMSEKSDAIVLRAQNNADVQRVLDVMEMLRASGYANLVLVP